MAPVSKAITSSTHCSFGVVVLAGGLARRMGGVDKGLVPINNRPMIEWVIDVVRAETSHVVINANRNTEQYLSLGVSVVSDVIEDFPGPLAGLLSAFEQLETEWILMVPCDSPFIRSELIHTLVGAAQNSQKKIVVAHDGERLQPVFAIVHRDLAPSLRGYLERGDRKIDLWYAEVGFDSADCSEHASMFENINTPEEQQAAEKRLAV